MIILYRIFHSALLSFRRNGWLSLLSIFIMSQALLIFALFFALRVVLGVAIEAINAKLDLAIYFKDNAKEEEIQALREELSAWPDISQVLYVSKGEALKRYLEQNRGNRQLIEVIGQDEDLFPASLEVKVKDPYRIERVVENLDSSSSAALIKSTSFSNNQELIKRLRSFAALLGRGSFFLGLFFLLIALLIIFNTVRIAIFTRREEIEIMKLVGATDWYIRWPFIIEGMFYGLFATLFSTLVIYLLYLSFAQPVVIRFLLSDLGSSAAGLFSPVLLLQLILLQLFVGLVVGGLSSFWATKKYL